MPSWRSLIVRSAVSGMTAVALAASSSLGQTTSDASLFRGLEWRNVSNNMGGRATTAVGVRSNTHLYYAGYTGGGLWKTEGGGRSWLNISDGSFDSGSIRDIAVYNQDPSIIYVGAAEVPGRGEMSTFWTVAKVAKFHIVSMQMCLVCRTHQVGE